MKDNVYNELNTYLANITVLYVKVHNLHWNVVGKEFKSTHEYLETLYDSFAITLDEVAEMMKINNKKPAASMKHYLELTSIKELDSVEYTVSQTIEIVKEDISTIKESVENIRKLANEEDNYDVVSMLEGHLTNYNKTLWFLDSMTK